MEFEVIEVWRGSHFIILMRDNYKRKTLNECVIAKKLGLTFDEYENLLIQNGGFLNNNYYYCFRTEKECQDFIDKVIEPRLIMEELTNSEFKVNDFYFFKTKGDRQDFIRNFIEPRLKNIEINKVEGG